MRRRRSLLAPAVASCVAVALVALPAATQVVDADLRGQVFFEPSSESQMLVLAPAASLVGRPADFLAVDAAYRADIVSGATEAIKAGPLLSDTPDIVSHASVSDFRHVVGGGATLRRPHAELAAGYERGWENDYRSSTITVTAGADFFQRNTELMVAYSHGFDEVCDLAVNETQDATRRQRLESSDGCFSDAEDRRAVDISIDTFHGVWSQSWTPVFATQAVFTGSLQEGLLVNPYRAVVIGPSGEFAQESHPDTRGRAALALRGRYYLRPLETAVGLGVRGYRDTWEIQSQTVEVDAERNVAPALRAQVHGRFYSQSGAVFWSDDYTGGEPDFGPRGQYFSGDRELSPLSSLLGGVRLTVESHGAPEDRVGAAFLDFETSVSGDVVKTFLHDFTWAGQDPDDTLALILSFNVTGSF